MRGRRDKQRRKFIAAKYVALIGLAGCVVFAIARYTHVEPAAHAESSPDLVEQAIYTRQEFFGADAIVPVPTEEARENLLRLTRSTPNDPAVVEKLSEVEEKLGNYDAAEKDVKQLIAIDKKYSNNLTTFYDRRGRYAKEAAL